MTEELQEKVLEANRTNVLWTKLAATAFGLLSVVIGIGGAWAKQTVDQVVAAQSALQTQWQIYIVAQESRITRLEERQAQLLRGIAELTSEMHAHEKSENKRRGND